MWLEPIKGRLILFKKGKRNRTKNEQAKLGEVNGKDDFQNRIVW